MAERILKLVRVWAKKLELHPRTEIVIKGVEADWDPGARTKQWVLQVDNNMAEYRRWWLEMSTGLLDHEGPLSIEGYVVHELVHIMLYRYTWLAEQLDRTEGDCSPLGEVEEVIVNDITGAMCALAGVDDGSKG
jgi:hypothetical protein